jgi:hypothetical protein
MTERASLHFTSCPVSHTIMTASSPPRQQRRYNNSHDNGILITRTSTSTSSKSLRRLVLLGSGMFLGLFLTNLFRQAFRLRDDAWYYYNYTETTPLLLQQQQLGFGNTIAWLMMERSGSTNCSSSRIDFEKNQSQDVLASKSSSKPKRNAYYYDEPLLQEDVNVFQGVQARAFEPWSHGPIPCFKKFSETKKTKGLLFLKTLKTGSTTTLNQNGAGQSFPYVMAFGVINMHRAAFPKPIAPKASCGPSFAIQRLVS